MLSDFAVSQIRTYVPLAVGAALTWLAGRLDVVLDGQQSAGATAVAVALVTGAYYFVARALERRWPKLGVLLGASKQPAYRGTH